MPAGISQKAVSARCRPRSTSSTVPSPRSAPRLPRARSVRGDRRCIFTKNFAAWDRCLPKARVRRRKAHRRSPWRKRITAPRIVRPAVNEPAGTGVASETPREGRPASDSIDAPGCATMMKTRHRRPKRRVRRRCLPRSQRKRRTEQSCPAAPGCSSASVELRKAGQSAWAEFALLCASAEAFAPKPIVE